MAHTEDETTAVMDEAPAVEKAEKPKRAPRKKKEAVAEEPAEAVAAAAAAAEEAAAPVVDEEPEPVAEAATAPATNGDKKEPDVTLDIRMLKEMKLPDLTKLAKDLGLENEIGRASCRERV